MSHADTSKINTYEEFCNRVKESWANLLESMSADDIRTEIKRQEEIVNRAQDNIVDNKKALAKKLSEFLVWDIVVDGNGVKWEITDLSLSRNNMSISYYGRRLKKNGVPGNINGEIKSRPVTLVSRPPQY
jgi:hypothetical protein